MHLNCFSNYSEDPDLAADIPPYVAQAVGTLSGFRVVRALEAISAWKDAVRAQLDMEIYPQTLNISPCPEEQERIYSDKNLMKKITNLCQPDMEVYEQSLKKIITRLL